MAINLGSTQRSFLTFTLIDDNNSIESSRASHENTSETSEIDNKIIFSNLTYNVSGINFQTAEYAAVLTGILSASEKRSFDFQSINKFGLCKNLTVNFTKIKTLLIHNRETTYGNDINIHATGTAGLTGIFNGGSGNFLIKPYSTFNFSDVYSGVSTSASNSTLTIEDAGGNGAVYRIIVVGNTGV